MLTEHECDDQVVQDSRLVVHELVMNGVRHGEPDAPTRSPSRAGSWRRTSSSASSTRAGTGTVATRPASAQSIDGRGLAIVDALSERWSVDRNGGTRVEAWLPR